MPTAEHAELMQGVGSWVGTLQSFMPGAPAEPMAATEEVVAVGGFWTHARFSCMFMGQPYVGTGCVGYDAATGSYVGTWIDNTSSYLAMMQGKKIPGTDDIEMRWMAPSPEGVMTAHRSVTNRTDNAYTITFYSGDGAGEKIMVIAMQRKG